MTKSEQTSLLLVAALGAVIYLMQRRKPAVAQLPADSFGGGLAGRAQIPDVVMDYFSGRSVAEVMANPGPLFRRDVLEYRREGGNYPAPAPAFIDQGQYL